MVFPLIPNPLSILFLFVFGFACLAVLWKLRKRSKIYSLLFKTALIVVTFFFIVLLYSVITMLF
jgi:hypothetical protein